MKHPFFKQTTSALLLFILTFFMVKVNSQTEVCAEYGDWLYSADPVEGYSVINGFASPDDDTS